MKKSLTLALALVVLAAFTGLGAAQEGKAQQKSQPATGEKKINENANQYIQQPCKGYPQDKRCCDKNGGNWVEGGGGGFCYMNLRSATGVSQEACRRIGGVVWHLSDGTLMCVPKGTKPMTGKVTQVNEKAKTFTVTVMAKGEELTVMAKGKELIFNAANLKLLPKVGEIIDVSTGPAQVMVCGRNGAGDMACCATGDGCFVYKNL